MAYPSRRMELLQILGLPSATPVELVGDRDVFPFLITLKYLRALGDIDSNSVDINPGCCRRHVSLHEENFITRPLIKLVARAPDQQAVAIGRRCAAILPEYPKHESFVRRLLLGQYG